MDTGKSSLAKSPRGNIRPQDKGLKPLKPDGFAIDLNINRLLYSGHIIMKLKTDLLTFLRINRIINLLWIIGLFSIPFIGRMPQFLAVTIICVLIFSFLFTVIQSLGFLTKVVALACPECKIEGSIEADQGFVCPNCGPIKCNGWLVIRTTPKRKSSARKH